MKDHCLDRVWYAVQKERTDSWDFGSYHLDKAIEYLREQGCRLIVIVDDEHDVALEEITYEEVMSC